MLMPAICFAAPSVLPVFVCCFSAAPSSSCHAVIRRSISSQHSGTKPANGAHTSFQQLYVPTAVATAVALDATALLCEVAATGNPLLQRAASTSDVLNSRWPRHAAFHEPGYWKKYLQLAFSVGHVAAAPRAAVCGRQQRLIDLLRQLLWPHELHLVARPWA